MEKIKKLVTIVVDVEIEMPFEYEDAILGLYQETMDTNGEVNDIYEHIAYNFVINGEDSFIEGIGVINGESPVRASLDEPCNFDIADIS